MLKEFKEFAMKGNVIDLAVGVVIGAAFQKIIDSLVNDIIMPLIAALLGQVDFSNLSFIFSPPFLTLKLYKKYYKNAKLFYAFYSYMI